MPNLLNYKYEIFPTAPQKAQLYRILRESKIQWNKAVTIRKKLKAALVSGQIEYVINTCLSAEKSNTQGQRVKAIEKFRAQYPGIDFDTAARCYDVKALIGKALGDLPPERLLDVKYLAEQLKAKHKEEVSNRREALAKGIERKRLPRLTVFWQLLGAINKYAGYAAAQAAAPETGRTATRMNTHGTTVQSDCDFAAGFRVRGSFGRGGSLFYQNTALPDLWKEEAPRAFKSLIQMGIVRSVTMQATAKTGIENPP